MFSETMDYGAEGVQNFKLFKGYFTLVQNSSQKGADGLQNFKLFKVNFTLIQNSSQKRQKWD